MEVVRVLLKGAETIDEELEMALLEEAAFSVLALEEAAAELEAGSEEEAAAVLEVGSEEVVLDDVATDEVVVVDEVASLETTVLEEVA